MHESDLSRLFAEADARDDRPSRPLPEAQMMTLTEWFERFHTPNPYKPGDFVTSRRGSIYRSRGEPFIVMEVFDTVRVNEEYHSKAMIPINMRIALIDNDGDVAFHSIHHSAVEPYDPNRGKVY